jgi:hypothetical protein
MLEERYKLFADPAGTLDALKALGANTVRLYVPWSALAPDPKSRTAPSGVDLSSPSAYPAAGWQPYDTVIREAAARGIDVMLNPGGPSPLWAAGAGAPAGTPDSGADWKPSASLYGDFMRAVGTRYNGSYSPPGGSGPLPKVKQWSIWNEPNYGVQLAPQATDNSSVEVSPALYRGLVDAAWTSLTATGHDHDTILWGELAPRGITGPNYPGNFSGMVPLRFLRALYCVDKSLHKLQGAAATARGCPASAADSQAFVKNNPALFQASGVALHPYPQGDVAPNVVTPNQPDYADLAAVPRVEQLLDKLTATYGSHAKLNIYSTEFGYKTNPPYQLGAPMAKAVAYLAQAEYQSWRDPRIRMWDQYLLLDPPPASKSNFVTGLAFYTGAPKPTYDAWRLPVYLPQTSGAAHAPLEVWGCVRPVRYAADPAAHHAAIQFRPASGGAFKTVKTVKVSPQDCYFDSLVRFPSSGTVQIAWSAPGQPAIHSRQIPITLS